MVHIYNLQEPVKYNKAAFNPNVVFLSLLYTLLSKTQVLGATTLIIYMLFQKTLDYALAISSLSFNIKTQQPECLCVDLEGLQQLIFYMVNTISCQGGGERCPFSLKTYFRQGQESVAFCSAVAFLWLVGFLFNHFSSRRHLPNLFFFWLFHIRSVWTNLQLKPVVAFCGVHCTCFEVCC